MLQPLRWGGGSLQVLPEEARGSPQVNMHEKDKKVLLNPSSEPRLFNKSHQPSTIRQGIKTNLSIPKPSEEWIKMQNVAEYEDA